MQIVIPPARHSLQESGATLVYLSASAQRDRMGWQAADRHKKLGGQPRAVGYIFLPEATGDARQGRAQRSMHKRPGIEAQQVCSRVGVREPAGLRESASGYAQTQMASC